MRKHLLTIAVFLVLIGLFAFAANDWRVPFTKTSHGSDWCEAHQIELSRCEACNPKLARGGTIVTREREPKPGECPNTLVRITLGPAAAQQVNLEFQTLEMRQVAETIRANAETQYPPSKLARVAPRLAGIVRQVPVSLGQDVDEGAVLAEFESFEFGKAKGDYLQALAVRELRQQKYDQERALAEKKISTARDLLQAETEWKEASLAVEGSIQRLSAFGLLPDKIREIAEKKDTSARMILMAPFKGRIVEASAVPGETATPEKPVFTIADMDRLWIAIDLYEADLPKIERDQRVTFTLEGLPGQRFPGKVVAIGGEVDDRTRTARVFADVKNVKELLRAKMFGRAEIIVKPPSPKLLVPKAAVQSDGDCTLVFVSPVPNVYQARKIQLGTVYDGGYEVVSGLAADERVVTTGSFLLKTEVLRGQMGAG